MATPTATRTTTTHLPVYHAPEMYPQSPILSFPPPAPAAGRSLLERGGMNLRIKTSFGAPNDTGRSPGKLHIQPHRNNLPRRRNPKRMRSLQPQSPLIEKDAEELKEKPAVEEKEQVFNEKATTAAPALGEIRINRPPHRLAETVIGVWPEDSDHLSELIPGLCLAFLNDVSAEHPKHDSGEPWTHIVNITYAAKTESHNGSSEQSYRDGVQRLHLVLPSATRTGADSTIRLGLGLTDAHLRTVRDFIAQALPRHIAEAPEQTAVRVLITTPHGRPTDALCAAGCYLSFASGREVSEVLRFVDEEVDFLSIWKGEVSEDECEHAQKIARSWSWLNQVNNPSE